MENKNKPAFPIVSSEGIAINTEYLDAISPGGAIGLTKEEYYAGVALQGILSKGYGSAFSTADLVAEHSLKYAKALCKLLEVKELENRQSGSSDYVE
ncbi:hypothetical protein HZP84_03895 [Elizabethkingia anophelis]|nr:hypothetical protein [Elizabethkingia anophelis]